MSAGLSEMALNEKAAINNMFDRETAREKNLEKVGHGGPDLHMHASQEVLLVSYLASSSRCIQCTAALR